MESGPKNVLVTGAAKRLGRAIAMELAERGWSVAVHHRKSQKEAEETAEAIRKKGIKAFVLGCDRSSIAVFAAAQTSLRRWRWAPMPSP